MSLNYCINVYCIYLIEICIGAKGPPKTKYKTLKMRTKILNVNTNVTKKKMKNG